MKKIRVGILFGGKSAEHEISLRSARNVVEAMDREKYEPILIGIDKTGRWVTGDAAFPLIDDANPKLFKLNSAGASEITLVPQNGGALMPLRGGVSANIDVVFPILHGPFGEDGTVQGLLKLAGVPFVGSGVLGSAVGMDKDVMKRLLRDAGLPIGDFIVFRSPSRVLSFAEITSRLGNPVFVKPANLGSSVGISKVADAASFTKAVELAFAYDSKILVEANIKGREIECAVLGNDEPSASLPGEIIPRHDFYSYEAKYMDDNGAGLQIPAKLPAEIVERVQLMAVRCFEVLCADGLARVDFFLQENGELLINEINTMPGFTSVSMYPKMWEASGISYRELISRLIELAREKFDKEKKLKTTYVA